MSLVRPVVRGTVRGLVRGTVREGDSVLGLLDAYWLAKYYDASTDSLLEQAGKGVGNAVFADTNDPTRHAYDPSEGACIDTPGSANNSFSIADHTGIDITDDIDVRYDLIAPTYETGTERALIAKYPGVGNFSYMAFFTGANELRIRWSPNGTTEITGLTTGTSLMAGQRYQLRLTLDVDNGLGGYTTTSYFRSDGNISSHTGWTQIGQSVTNSGTTSIFSGNGDLYFASSTGSARMLQARTFGAQVYAGIAGSLVADIAPNLCGQTGYTDPISGQPIALNRSATGLKTALVTRPALQSDGADDYLTVGATGLPASGYLYSYQRDHATDGVAKITETEIADASSGLQFFDTDEEGFAWGFRSTALSSAQQAHLKSAFDGLLGGSVGE